VLAPVVADVPPGPQEGRPRSEITLALDQATRLPVPAMELLAADGGQHVRQVLGGDRPAPAVTGPVEQLVGLAEVPDLGGVVGPAQDLGEPVLGPSLPPRSPTASNDDRAWVNRRRATSSSPTSDSMRPRASSARASRCSSPAPRARSLAAVAGAAASSCRPSSMRHSARPSDRPMTSRGSSPVDASAAWTALLQRLGQPGLVGERAVGPAAEVPDGEAGQVPVTGLDGAGAAQSPGLLVVVGQLGDGLLGQGSASSQVATWRCRADRSRRGIDS
jgi:hypothetical protein